MTQPFSPDALVRFSRQILLREVGGRGQRRLGEGVCGLCVVDWSGLLTAQYLLRAGVGQLDVAYVGEEPALWAALRALATPPPAQSFHLHRGPLTWAEVPVPPRISHGCWLPLGSAPVAWALHTPSQILLGQGIDSLPPARLPILIDALSPTAVILGSALAHLLLQQRLRLAPDPAHLLSLID
jgi:hypothetical protein